AVAKIVNARKKLGALGILLMYRAVVELEILSGRGPLRVLVIHEEDAVLVTLEHLSYVAAAQMQVRGIRAEAEQLRIGHRHALMDFFRPFPHLVQMIVHACRESHLACRLTDFVERFAHRLERSLHVGAGSLAAGRKDAQMVRPENLEKG